MLHLMYNGYTLIARTIVVKHKIFYGQKKRQTKSSKDQISPRPDCCPAGPGRGQAVAGCDNQSREDTIGVDTGHAVGCGLKLDAASLGLAIRDCKEREFSG